MTQMPIILVGTQDAIRYMASLTTAQEIEPHFDTIVPLPTDSLWGRLLMGENCLALFEINHA